MRNFVITLILGAVIGFGCAKAFDQDATASSNISIEAILKEGAVIGVLQMEIKEGTTEEEFERFMTEEYFPATNAAMPDAKWMLMKSDRGEMAGTYAVLAYHPDTNVREKYWPAEGGMSEITKEISENVKDLNERRLQMSQPVGNRDYIVIK